MFISLFAYFIVLIIVLVTVPFLVSVFSSGFLLFLVVNCHLKFRLVFCFFSVIGPTYHYFPFFGIFVLVFVNVSHTGFQKAKSGADSFRVCLDDEHSDREPERHRYVRVFLHADDGCCRGGRHSYVTRQRLGSVRLSRLAHKKSALEPPLYIKLWHFTDDAGPLRRRGLSGLVQ